MKKRFIAKTPNEFLIYCYLINEFSKQNFTIPSAKEIKENLDLNLKETTIERILKKFLTSYQYNTIMIM